MNQRWKKCCTSTIFLRISRNRMLSASAFFLRREWPFWAPFRRAFITVCALNQTNTLYLVNFINFISSCHDFPTSSPHIDLCWRKQAGFSSVLALLCFSFLRIGINGSWHSSYRFWLSPISRIQQAKKQNLHARRKHGNTILAASRHGWNWLSCLERIGSACSEHKKVKTIITKLLK